MVMAPVVRDRKGSHEKVFADAKRAVMSACGSTA